MVRFAVILFLTHVAFFHSAGQAQDILGYEIDESNSIDSKPSPPPASSRKIPVNSNTNSNFPPSKPAATAFPSNANSNNSDGAAPTPTKVNNAPTGTGYLKMEDYYQTWNARKLKQGISYSPLLNVAQYDRWITPKWGFFVGLRYAKSTDNFIESKTSTYNPTTLALSEDVSFAGSRNPTTLVLMVGAKGRIWQNDFMQVNWGPLLMYTHGTSVTYATGRLTRNVANVNNPNDYTMVETSLGSVSTGVDPTYSLGVKVGTEFYVKWFPHLALCADVVFMNQFPLKGTTETNTVSRTRNVVAGVPQSPTSEQYNNSRVYNDYGGGASTSQVGAQYFALLGTNWSIKYVW